MRKSESTTKRERAVELYKRGLAVEQIAERLGTTRGSIDNMLYKARLNRSQQGLPPRIDRLEVI